MIVKSIPTGWEIIYQRAHGLLAAELAFHRAPADRPPHFVEVLMAIAEHDDGVPESKRPENLTAAGAPCSFQLLDFNEEQCRNVMEIATSKSRWNALLTSMHLSFLYAEKVRENATVRAFVKEQQHVQKKLLSQLGLSRPEAGKIYRFMEWCDALSLLLCLDSIQPEQRRMDISEGPDGVVNQLWEDEKNRLRVEPWPFGTASFEVQVEYRELNQLKFSTSRELDECLRQAPVQVRSWVFAKN